MDELIFIGVEDRQKKKKTIIIGGALFLVALLIGVVLLWPSGQRHDNGHRQTSTAVSVNAPLRGEKGGTAATLLLRPSPEELMAAIAAINKAQLPLDLTQYQDARVLWLVYYFKIRSMDGAAALVMFDSSADGFGVSIQGEIDSAEFPEIKQLQPGQKVWLAGRIAAADAAGTGSVRLAVDYCNTDGDTPLDQVVRDMKARQSAK